jgi:DNA-binding IclR family transcriptional regulator
LEEVARRGAGVTARQVSENLSLPRATTYRILNLLVEDEYLVRLPDIQGFALGKKVSELAGYSPVPQTPVVLQNLLSDIRGGVRGGVHLVSYQNQQLRILDADPDFPLTDPVALANEPLRSAMGRLLLADMSPTDAMDRTQRNWDELDEILTPISIRGYALQRGAFLPSLGCISMPIRQTDGELTAGLTLSLPVARLDDHADALNFLTESTARIAEHLIVR